MTERALPAGFILKAVTTEASGVAYEVEVPQAESLQAILDAYAAEGKNGEEILLQIWNAGNEQGGKQGQKTAVRDAIGKSDAEVPTDDPDVVAAIESHQTTARQFIQGAPRGGGGQRHESGLTAKQRTALGTAVAMHMATHGTAPNKAEMAAIAKEVGVPLDLIG